MEVVEGSYENNISLGPTEGDSSALNNVPIVPLSAVPNNIINFQNPQERRQVQNITSPKGNANSTETIRSKLRETFAAALAMVADEQSKKLSVHDENNSQMQIVLYEGNKGVAVASDIENLNESSNSGNDKSFIVDSSENLKADSPTNLKRVRDDSCGDDSMEGSEKRQCMEIETISPHNDLDSNALTLTLPEELATSKQKILEDESKSEASGKDDLVQMLAKDIEGELFRKYNGVSKKYKEKGRSLMFNLKDKNNPELRARVVSGEITPEALCSMSAEELASKELSQWRINKANELDNMKVLPDADNGPKRLVKKTHKGEYQVVFIGNDDVVPEVSVGTTLQLKLDEDIHGSTEIPAAEKGIGIQNDNNQNETMENSPRNLTLATTVETAGKVLASMNSAEEKTPLPKLLSFDEYIKSTMNDPSHDNVETEYFSEATKSYIQTINDSVCQSLEKLWEGALQLNPSNMQTVSVFFKSGDKTSTKEWPANLEVKGRVRLDAFENFMQELRHSRSRTVMIALITYTRYSENVAANIQEVAESYKQSERVGFAEPAPGVELYLCPPDDSIFKILNKYFSQQTFEDLNNMVGFIGCVVWRMNNVNSNVMLKVPKHNTKTKEYVNANKFALSSQIMDSPTPEDFKSASVGKESSKFGMDHYHPRNTSTHPSNESLALPSKMAMKKTNSHHDEVKGIARCSSRPTSVACENGMRNYHPTTNDDELMDDDVPPGFGPETIGHRSAMLPNPPNRAMHSSSMDDDDDLPEFDYNPHPEVEPFQQLSRQQPLEPYQPHSRQYMPPVTNSMPQYIPPPPPPAAAAAAVPVTAPLSQLTSTAAAAAAPPSGPMPLLETAQAPQVHMQKPNMQNLNLQQQQQTSRTPTTGTQQTAADQIRELIHKYGHGDHNADLIHKYGHSDRNENFAPPPPPPPPPAPAQPPNFVSEHNPYPTTFNAPPPPPPRDQYGNHHQHRHHPMHPFGLTKYSGNMHHHPPRPAPAPAPAPAAVHPHMPLQQQQRGNVNHVLATAQPHVRAHGPAMHMPGHVAMAHHMGPSMPPAHAHAHAGNRALTGMDMQMMVPRRPVFWNGSPALGGPDIHLFDARNRR